MSLCCSALVACSSDDDPERLILPQTVPGPSVSFPVQGEPAGQLELNELLVGATVDDATEKLEAAGWEVRLYDLDDPNAGVTPWSTAVVESCGSRSVDHIVEGADIRQDQEHHPWPEGAQIARYLRPTQISRSVGRSAWTCGVASAPGRPGAGVDGSCRARLHATNVRPPARAEESSLTSARGSRTWRVGGRSGSPLRHPCSDRGGDVSISDLGGFEIAKRCGARCVPHPGHHFAQ